MIKELPREMPGYAGMPCGGLGEGRWDGEKVGQRPSVLPALPELLSYCSVPDEQADIS